MNSGASVFVLDSGPDKETKMHENKTDQKTWTEEFKVSGGEILNKLKELLHEGNIRRIILKDEQGKTFIEFPLTMGIVGAALLPVLAAIGAIAALVSKLTIVVEKVEN
jgi:Flp pilus assembly pilin Flp